MNSLSLGRRFGYFQDTYPSPGSSPDDRSPVLANAVRGLGTQFKPLQPCDGQAAALSALQGLRNELLVGGRLNLSALSQHLALLATRERRLALAHTHRLFSYPRVGLPGADEDNRALSYVVPKPLDCAKAILADEYLQKYGVRIVPVLAPSQNGDYLRSVVRHLSAASGEPVGFLLRVISDHRHTEVFDYENHVLPLVIQAGAHGIDVINLNSMGEVDNSYQRFLKNMDVIKQSVPGVEVRSATVLSQRQADEQSCHTDAIQVLKDALLRFRRSGQSSFFNCMLGHAEVALGDVDEPRFCLPSALQKTTQRSAALRNDAVNFAEPVEPKGHSLHSHREKYSAAFQVSPHIEDERLDKPVNHFLTIKAFRNADRVLSVLEGLAPSERKRYLNQLRQQW
ncbi:hypothetical protein EV673_3034 [Limnobacter thiooxidans]|uniref:hypothetical protein n=1 Tax=Limnobacter thiooxidans TaxID=131080 RepID=UPI00102DC26E|nr:hypothetical protein EV673_3034 [Limnobacter thiooxidans]BET24907.1 hypothetical protein RGQ30_04080 [Limnobacter thiooxidans]